MNRLLFILIAAFWVVMNVLLWKSEFGQGSNEVPVPVRMVVMKLLNAPDQSRLNVFHHGTAIGWVKWNVLLEGSTGDPEGLEGMIRHPSHYNIDIEGNVMVSSLRQRLRFFSMLTFTTNSVWRDFSANFNLKPFEAGMFTAAGERAVTFWLNDGSERIEKRLTFDELRKPDRLFNELGLEELGLLIAPAMLQMPSGAGTKPAPGLEWEAFLDWTTIGSEKLRVYRLQARLVDRYRIVVLVGRMGEILRVELPNGMVLENDRAHPFG